MPETVLSYIRVQTNTFLYIGIEATINDTTGSKLFNIWEYKTLDVDIEIIESTSSRKLPGGNKDFLKCKKNH